MVPDVVPDTVGTTTVLCSVSVEEGLPLFTWSCGGAVGVPFSPSHGEVMFSHGEVLLSPLPEGASGSSLSVGLFLRFSAAGLGLMTAPGFQENACR